MQTVNKNGATIIIADDGKITLLKGSKVNAALGASASPKVKELRNAKTNGSETTEDIIFDSLSAAASFIRGAQTNGKAYFAAATSGTATAKPAAPKKPKTAKPAKAEKPTETTGEESAPTKAEKPAAGFVTLTKTQMEAANNLAHKVKALCLGFAYNVSERTINQIKYENDPAAFIVNCMELEGFDDALLEDARRQMKSAEALQLFADIKAAPASHGRINQRLEVIYGPKGTGKTTMAEAENPGAKTIIASAGLDPDDLFTVIDPNTKKWVLTELGQALCGGNPETEEGNGQVIIIDEMNLYNEVVCQRIQGITDNKKEIYDRGIRIPIKPGFKIVATMNLESNVSGKKPLPDPLVSRCGRIVKLDNPWLGWIF